MDEGLSPCISPNILLNGRPVVISGSPHFCSIYLDFEIERLYHLHWGSISVETRCHLETLPRPRWRSRKKPCHGGGKMVG